jgi:hypothetical protein
MTTYVHTCTSSDLVWDTQIIDITIWHGSNYGKGFLAANIPVISCKNSTGSCNPSQPGKLWDFTKTISRFEYIRQLDGETYDVIDWHYSDHNCENICTYWDDTYNQ